MIASLGMLLLPAPACAAATHFLVTAPTHARTGAAFNFSITSLDSSNQIDPSYAGTVHFTSSDGAAILPADSMPVGGGATFNATLPTEGLQTITATDTIDTSITGISGPIATSSATALSLAVPSVVTSGDPFQFTATALNANGQVDQGYLGIAAFSESTGNLGPTFAQDSMLSGGSKTLTVRLFSPTRRQVTISAFDRNFPSVTGTSAPITLLPPNAFQLASTKRDLRRGTLTLDFGISGPGILVLRGRRVRAEKIFAQPPGPTTRAIPAKLVVRARGRARKKHRETGKVRVGIQVTYTPNEGAPNTESMTVTLRKNLAA